MLENGPSAEDMGLPEEDMQVEGTPKVEKSSGLMDALVNFRDKIQKLPGGGVVLAAAYLAGAMMSGERAQAGEINYAKLAMSLNEGTKMQVPVHVAGEFHVGGAKLTAQGLEAPSENVGYGNQWKMSKMYEETGGFAGDYKNADIVKSLQSEESLFENTIDATCQDKAAAKLIKDTFDHIDDEMWSKKIGGEAKVMDSNSNEMVPINDASVIDATQNKIFNDINISIDSDKKIPDNQKRPAIISKLVRMDKGEQTKVMDAIMRYELRTTMIAVEDARRDSRVAKK